MKKIILNIALLVGAISTSFAQFTIDSTGLVPTGAGFVAGNDYSEGVTPDGCTNYALPGPTVANPGMFYAFQDYGNSVHAANDCSGAALAAGAGIGPGNTGDYSVSGTVGIGLNIVSGYTIASWAPTCVAVNPTFGFHLGTQCASAGNSYNNLSNAANPISLDLNTTPANRILYVNYIGNAGTGTPTLNTKLQLFRDPSNDAGAGAFGGAEVDQPSANFILDGTVHQLVVDFTGTTVSSAVILAAVRQVSFIYYGTTITDDYNVKILALSIGSAPVASTKASLSVSSSKLYPNPVSDMANVDLELNASSDVKVTLTDMMGKEVMTIAEGTYSSLSKSFSVANLNKGIYNVNYTVNGAAAKSEMLMVK